MKKLLQNQKKNKFVLCVLLLALLASLALMTGCGNNDAQDGDAGADGQDTAKETLVVGLDDTFAPMGFRDEQGNLVGFDIDLATAVADELGMQAEFKPIDWNAKEMELKAGHDRLRMERNVHHTGASGEHGTDQQVLKQQDRADGAGGFRYRRYFR